MNLTEKRQIEIIEDDDDISVVVVQTPDKKRKLENNIKEPAGLVRDEQSCTTTECGLGKENMDPKISPSGKVKKTTEEKEAERLAREEAKAEREKQRVEKQRIRELEKKRRDEERLKREEEKQKREEEREAKRKEKEEAENKREQEKRAKERAQPRIASFFTRKQTEAATPKSTPNEDISSDAYKSDFLSFHVKSNMTMFKGSLYENEPKDKTSNFLQWVRDHKVARGYQFKQSAKSVLESLSGDSVSESEIPGLMDTLCMKHLQFAEDLRPPYVGTWSKLPSPGADSFTRIQGIEYDYDSEVEWVDDEEGEDIADEDELSGDEAADSDEMEDFLDDENDISSNRAFTTSKVAIAKWNDGNSVDAFGKYCIQYCITVSGGIDPYQDYWGMEKALVAESPTFKGIAKKPLPVSITQLNEIIGLVRDTEGPKNIVVHVVSQKLDAKNLKVSKKTIESVMSRCMEKGNRNAGDVSGTPKSSKAWCVIPSKLEFEQSLINKIQLKI